MKKYCIALLWSVYCMALQPESIQAQKIVVGEPMPDFVLHNIQYYPKKQASLKDFRGKWLMLDLWSKACGACIAGFPSLNTIQQTLKDSVQVMLIGNPDKEGAIEPMYKRLREKQGLSMPCAFDSVTWKQLVEGGVPNSILIDDKGIVRCWTIDLHLNEVRAIMKGETLGLKTPDNDDAAHRNKRIPYTPEIPLLINNNGAKADDMILRSLLCKWDRDRHNGWPVYQIDSNLAASGKLELLGYTAQQLYKLAYWGVDTRIRPEDTVRYGKWYNKLIPDLSDSALFDDDANYRYNKNLYSYSLILPREKSSIDVMQQTMRQDLKRYFGYEVRVEQRKCPCWKLQRGPDADKKLKSIKKISNPEAMAKGGIWGNDIAFEWLLNYLRNLMSDYLEDDTGIQGKVNFIMDATANIEQTKKALQENGLELVRGEKEMTVVVISKP